MNIDKLRSEKVTGDIARIMLDDQVVCFYDTRGMVAPDKIDDVLKDLFDQYFSVTDARLVEVCMYLIQYALKISFPQLLEELGDRFSQEDDT